MKTRSVSWYTVIFFLVICVPVLAAIKGDVTQDNKVGLQDAMYSLQVAAGLRSGTATLKDAVYALQVAAGLKPVASYDGTETTFSLIRGGANQFLLPVEIGNQMFKLLVDTGSNALLLFEDKIQPSNQTSQIPGPSPAPRPSPRLGANPIVITDTPVSKSFYSATRSGVLAYAPVRIGAYSKDNMAIMLIRSPDSHNDPSLTSKGADGIIGLRRTEGLTLSLDQVPLDVPLAALMPAVSIFELNLPPAGEATLSFGRMAKLDKAVSSFVFRSKTLAVVDPLDPVQASYADLQVPFRASSSYGQATSLDLDILLDSGAVSKLVLDTQVAERLGYNPATGAWVIPDEAEIELNLIGPESTLALNPKFKVADVAVSPLSQMGVTFEAILGIAFWQQYVVGFNFVDYQSGGPDGTVSMLHRADMAKGIHNDFQAAVSNYVELPGLNSEGDDRFPVSDDSGNVVAFQSNRPGSLGFWDIFIWKRGDGIVPLYIINSEKDDSHPSLSGDGRYLVFQSDRDAGLGGYDIYLYDLIEKRFLDIPGLNSPFQDQKPSLSRDGRYIVFQSDMAGSWDVFMYDRTSSQLVNLPSLNTYGDENDPVVSENGNFILYTVSSGLGLSKDLLLYSVREAKIIDLPAAMAGETASVNTVYDEYNPNISPDGNYILFQSNRLHPKMGLHDTDVFVFDRARNALKHTSGLNTGVEDAAPFLNSGGMLLLHSNRPGGQGGSDIYLYRLDLPVQTVQPNPDLPKEQITLTRTIDNRFTIPVSIGGKTFQLLVDTTNSALILFRDKVGTGYYTDTATAVQLALPAGILDGTTGLADVAVGQYQANEMGIVLVGTQGQYDSAMGQTMAPADGVLGLRYANTAGTLAALQPFINTIELNLDPSENGSPGLTLGNLPLTGLADDYLAFNMSGNQPGFQTSSFTARTDAGGSFRSTGGLVLSSVLRDTLIIDTAVAASLGYQASTGWGQATTLFISIGTVGKELIIDSPYPVGKVVVTDLSGSGYQAILSLDRWQNFIAGLDANYQWTNQALILLDRSDVNAVQLPSEEASRHFLPLPGLNSSGDDVFGAISDDGKTIVFQSNRTGHWDIFLYRLGMGLVDLPGLNSAADEINPSLSGDGNLIAFESNRNGNPDIFLYDVSTQTFIDPGINTTLAESHPRLRADGAFLVLERELENIDSLATSSDKDFDIYLYDLYAQSLVTLGNPWLNTGGLEYEASLNPDGTMLAFEGCNREDLLDKTCGIFLYDFPKRGLVDLPALNSPYLDVMPRLSPDGKFLAFASNRNNPDFSDHGYDIFLLDLASGEVLSLPGLNSDFEDSAPVAGAQGEYLLFQSKRPGGQGGYDLYLYQRQVEENLAVDEQYTQTGYLWWKGMTKDSILNNWDSLNWKSMEGVTVIAVDASGQLLGTAVTDQDGYFTMIIPQGAVLPIYYVDGNGEWKIVTGDLNRNDYANDTYVPDFQAGTLQFTQVWVEDMAQAGFQTTIKFDVEAEVVKYNTYVKIDLKRGDPAAVTLEDPNYTPDYTLTALTIEQLGQRGPEGQTITKTQNGVTTTITYLPGTGNKKAHVEHTFIVPGEVLEGTYAVVFSINLFDYFSQDNALQNQATNYLVSPASMIIGQPDKPNLRILSAKLFSNSFELPDSRPVPDYVPRDYELSLNMEVEAMAKDAPLPVDVVFELEIDGLLYPMTFAMENEEGRLVKAGKRTYDTLLRQDQQGFSYKLYIDEGAYDLLSAKTSDTMVRLIATIDPNNTIEEFENNKADNVRTFSVMFLVKQEGPQAAPGRELAPYANTWFDYKNADSSGNDDFAIGYEFGPKLTYASQTYNGTTFPYAVDFDGNNRIWAKVFGLQFNVLGAGLAFNLPGDDILNLDFSYFVDVLGLRVYGFDLGALKSALAQIGIDMPDQIPLWSSQCGVLNAVKKKLDGCQTVEKYTKESRKTKSKTFIVYGVPITVEGGAVGAVGIKGAAKLRRPNKFVLEAGPYASLSGLLEGSLGFPGMQAGVGVRLTLIEVYLKLTPSAQLLPQYPMAILRFEAPIRLSTLNGYAYAFVRALLKKYEYSLISWTGLYWEIAFFPTLSAGFGAVNMYLTTYCNNESLYSNTNPNATCSGTTTTTRANEYIVAHNWGTGAPAGINADHFSAEWVGYFNFPEWDSYAYGGSWGRGGTEFGSTYTFFKNSDDNMTAWIDSNDDEQFTDDERLFNDSWGSARLDKFVPVGYHKVKVKYKENNGAAYANFWVVKKNTFEAWYFNNTTFSGDAVYYETTSSINYDWGGDSPKAGIVNADNFSVRWEGNFDFPAALDYIFVVGADDRIKVKIDDQEVINTGNTLNTSTTRWLTQGTHKITVEYFEIDGAARAKFNFYPKDTFVGYYFNNTDFTGNPALSRNERDSGLFQVNPSDAPGFDYQLKGDWRYNSPGSGVNNNDFTVRWLGAVNFNAGEYDFVAIQDDGMNVWIDDDLIFPHWDGASGWASLRTRTMTAGYHRIKIEFKEGSGMAEAVFKWGPHRKNEWTAYYWQNLTIKDIRKESSINYDWGGNSPATYLGGDFKSDYFTVIWDGDFDFDGAPYLFTLYGDNVLLVTIDASSADPFSNLLGTRGWTKPHREAMAMNPGVHHISVYYMESDGGAMAKFSWEKAAVNKFYGQYFNNEELEWWPVKFENAISPPLNYEWRDGGPSGVNSDHFSARWVGVFEFEQGVYTFTATQPDDGMRVWVDGEQIIDAWDYDGRDKTAKKMMTAGVHSIRVEHHEGVGAARAKLKWDKEGKNTFFGSFYNNKTLTGIPVKYESANPPLNFDWGYGSPSGVNVNDFSARWEGVFDFMGTTYTFKATADDGMKVWIDGELVIDMWAGGGYDVTAQREMTAGAHAVKVEYWEGGSLAKAKLSWTYSLNLTEKSRFETAHPYPANQDLNDTLYIRDANTIQVTVSGETEFLWDWISITDCYGNVVMTDSGKINRSFQVGCPYVDVRFHSDYNKQKSGVTVQISKVQ